MDVEGETPSLLCLVAHCNATVLLSLLRVDVKQTGRLDVHTLADWAKEAGLSDLTDDQLQIMIARADTTKTGTVEFWEFFAMMVDAAL